METATQLGTLSALEASRLVVDRYGALLGDVFGSGALASWLAALVQLHRPETVVELGCGYGVTALRLALAARQAGTGRVISVDDFVRIEDRIGLAETSMILRAAGILPEEETPGSVRDLVQTVARRAGLEDWLQLHTAELDLAWPHPVEGLELDRPVDLLFCDFNHGPESVIRQLAAWLPHLADDASMVFDSASTWWPSYLALEQAVQLLSRGVVPATFREWGWDDAMEARVRQTHFQLVHLTQVDGERQNGAAWLKLAPHDLVPRPRTRMRSATWDWESG